MDRVTETLVLVREIARMLHDVRTSALKPQTDPVREWEADLDAIEKRATELMAEMSGRPNRPSPPEV